MKKIKKMTLEEMQNYKKEIHRKNCDNCFRFMMMKCGGAMYHIPPHCEQPLCDCVKELLNNVEVIENEKED